MYIFIRILWKLYSIKPEHLKDMKKFLVVYSLLKLNKDKIFDPIYIIKWGFVFPKNLIHISNIIQTEQVILNICLYEYTCI